MVEYFVLSSACLAGVNSRYDGKNSENEIVAQLVKHGKAIPVCPEQLGDLYTPRPSCEIIINEIGDKRVISKENQDCTKEYYLGAERTLAIAKVLGVKKVILKSKSPSCGCGLIYDGSYSGKLMSGNGITEELLINNGIEVFTEDNLELNSCF